MVTGRTNKPGRSNIGFKRQKRRDSEKQSFREQSPSDVSKLSFLKLSEPQRCVCGWDVWQVDGRGQLWCEQCDPLAYPAAWWSVIRVCGGLAWKHLADPVSVIWVTRSLTHLAIPQRWCVSFANCCVFGDEPHWRLNRELLLWLMRQLWLPSDDRWLVNERAVSELAGRAFRSAVIGREVFDDWQQLQRELQRNWRPMHVPAAAENEWIGGCL